MQELEETSYWLELLNETKALPQEKLLDLMKEADELMAILTTCVKNAKKKIEDKRSIIEERSFTLHPSSLG